MGPKTKKLLLLLDEAVPLLRQHPGGDHWADWMSKAAARIRKSDFEGILGVLGAYGGMGSFTDLILDDTLDRLREEIYTLADQIRREAEFE